MRDDLLFHLFTNDNLYYLKVILRFTMHGKYPFLFLKRPSNPPTPIKTDRKHA